MKDIGKPLGLKTQQILRPLFNSPKPLKVVYNPEAKGLLNRLGNGIVNTGANVGSKIVGADVAIPLVAIYQNPTYIAHPSLNLADNTGETAAGILQGPAMAGLASGSVSLGASGAVGTIIDGTGVGAAIVTTVVAGYRTGTALGNIPLIVNKTIIDLDYEFYGDWIAKHIYGAPDTTGFNQPDRHCKQ